MNDRISCEYIRDVYPDVRNGTAPPEVANLMRAHVASCDECRAEIALLDAVRAQSIAVPAGLHARVMHAVAQRPATGEVRHAGGRIVMAAAVAAALVGGSFLLQYTTRPSARARASASASGGIGSVGAVGVEDAMLSGKTSLEDLSVEQLEKLLGEAGS